MKKKYNIRKNDSRVTKQARELANNSQLKDMIEHLNMKLTRRALRKAVRGRRGIVTKLRKHFNTAEELMTLDSHMVKRFLINGR
jgi:tRNA C32,U32 (ribose-2'-O)-methylase TrmJ